MKYTKTLTWHTEEKPNPSTGNFLILTKEGNIAEAEYSEQKGWLQYRWNSKPKDVIACCRLSDIKLPEGE